MNGNNNNNEHITLEDFSRVVKWFEYSSKIKKQIKENINNAPKKEYFFISSEWINNFKKIFKYDSLKLKIKSHKNKNQNQNENPLNDTEIENIYNQIKIESPIIISIKDKQKLKIIKNNKILRNDLYINKNYYKDFILIDKQILDEFKKVYKIDEEIKFDILLGSGIFIISISNNIIEVGIFYQDNINIYQYELFLFEFSDINELNIEKERIKKEGIIDYFKSYEIKKEEINIKHIRKNNGKEMKIINLRKDQTNNQNNQNLINYPNNKINNDFLEMDLSRKRGLSNIDKDSPRLNSIIQLLTCIQEIKDYLFNHKEIIIKFNHLYILSSTLINIFEQLYNKEKCEENNVQKFNIILNFINPTQSKMHMEQYLLFILDLLHDELNLSSKKKIGQINLISFESPINDEKKALEIFYNYYNEYYQSIIADNFHWIRKKNYMCTRCNSSLYSFQAFPYIEFNLDDIQEYTLLQNTEYKQIFNNYNSNKNLLMQKLNEYKNKKLKIPIYITDCFRYYLSNIESMDINCNFCHQFGKNNCRKIIYKTPKYFCILLNRKTQINGIKITLDDELKLETYVDGNKNYKRYKLLGVLICNQLNEKNKHYSVIIRNVDQSWLLFDDEKITRITDGKSFCESNNNARLLLYKGIKY